MIKELFFQAISKYLAGVVLLFLLVFLPAGTLDDWNRWLLMGILFVPMFFVGIVMMCKNPELLRKRLNAKEKELGQSFVIKLSGLMFLWGGCDSGTELSFSVDHLADVGILGRGGGFPAFVSALRGGSAGKRLSLPHHRSEGKPNGH